MCDKYEVAVDPRGVLWVQGAGKSKEIGEAWRLRPAQLSRAAADALRRVGKDPAAYFALNGIPIRNSVREQAIRLLVAARADAVARFRSELDAGYRAHGEAYEITCAANVRWRKLIDAEADRDPARAEEVAAMKRELDAAHQRMGAIWDRLRLLEGSIDAATRDPAIEE